MSPPPKRKRGRPRKSPLTSTQLDSKPKRKRGRPRKTEVELPVCLSQPPGHTYLQDVEQALFCDLQIVCQDGTARCHKLVLAALSSHLSEVLQCVFENDDTLLLPDVSTADMVAFLDVIYAKLLGEDEKLSKDVEREFEVICDLLKVDVGMKPFHETSELFVSVQVAEDPLKHEDSPRETARGLCSWKRKSVFPEEDNLKTKALKEESQPSDNDHEPFELDDMCMESFKVEPEDFIQNVSETSTGNQTIGPFNQQRLASHSKKERQPKMSKVEIDKNFSDEIKAKRAEIERQVSDCSGELQVLLKHNFDWTFDNCIFAVVVAMKEADNGDLLAFPLAWSPKNQLGQTERYRQYTSFCESVQVAFGLSEAEVKNNLQLRRHVGLTNSTVKSFCPRVKFADYSKEKLEEVLKNEDIKRLIEPKSVNKPFEIDRRSSNLALKLDKMICTNDVQRIAILKLTNAGDLYVEFIKNHDENSQSSIGDMLISLLFDLWSLNCSQNAIGPADPLFHDYVTAHKLGKQAAVAKEYIANWDKVKAKRLSKQKLCQDCGAWFPNATIKERNAFQVHKEKHFVESHTCDCPDQGFNGSLNAKRNHVRLFHLKGFISCPHQSCVFVSKSKRMKKHFEYLHEEMTCELCSCKVRGTYGLEQHRACFHSDQPGVKAKEKSSVAGTCGHCGQFYRRLKQHVRTAHKQQPLPCDVCGQMFKTATTLKNHRIKVHYLEKKPHQCEVCLDRFLERDDLRNHVYKVHLHMKIFECRYQDCDMSYSEVGSRSNHERIRHGRPYPQAAKLGLVPPLAVEKSPFLKHIPSAEEIRDMLSKKA